MKQTKPAQAMELRSLSPVFDTYSQVSAGKADHVLTIRPEQSTDHEQVFQV